MINRTWIRVGPFLVIMFFVLLSDAILSDFVPVYIQKVVGSPFIMGLVMASSSVVGLLVDLIFPQALRGAGVRSLALFAIIGAGSFILTLLVSTWFPFAWILLVGMAAWGIYYELDAFMSKQFVADVAPPHSRSAVWGVVGVFRNLAYFLGPLIGAQIVWGGDRGVVLIAGGILVAAYIFFMLLRLPKGDPLEPTHGIHLIEEMKHWNSLGIRIWPVLILSLLAGVIDASFWTTGTVVNDMLALRHPAGGWFLSLYMLPSLFVGFVIARWGIYTGKKRWAEWFFAIGGLILATIGLSQQLWWILSVVVLSSIMFGLSWPLVDAVYSDYMVRMGRRGRKHMIGISSAMLSVAYIVGPILAGYLASRVGELLSFAYIGAITFVIAVLLIVVTPRKIRLPRTEMQAWDTDQ